ncbi:MAG: hypothetical protein AAGK37_21830 [Pseudomonadota bacterium]
MIRHAATLPDGYVAKRASSDRRYRYVIAIRHSFENDLREATELKLADARFWQFIYHEPDARRRRRRLHLIGGCKSAEAYQTFVAAERAAHVHRKLEAGAYEAWSPAGWFSARPAAEALLRRLRARPWVDEARIVEAARCSTSRSGLHGG